MEQNYEARINLLSPVKEILIQKESELRETVPFKCLNCVHYNQMWAGGRYKQEAIDITLFKKETKMKLREA